MKEFAVKSESFPLYEAFKKEAEKRGWKYNDNFNEFAESQILYSNCLYFSSEWNSRKTEPSFSFSTIWNNDPAKVYQLEDEWKLAIEALQIVQEKVTVTIDEIAEWKGCKPENIIIKMKSHVVF